MEIQEESAYYSFSIVSKMTRKNLRLRIGAIIFHMKVDPEAVFLLVNFCPHLAKTQI
jgi:hypothetical protein